MDRSDLVVESFAPAILCRYCGSHNLVKVGRYNGVQRYWCKVCNRKIKDDDSLFHSKVPAQCIFTALIMYFHDRTLDDIRYYLKSVFDYFPSKSVVFGWIRKYSEMARQVLLNNKPTLGDEWKFYQLEIRIRGNNVFIFGIHDLKTDYLLAVHATPVKNISITSSFINQAIVTTNKVPRVIYADKTFGHLKKVITESGLKGEIKLIRKTLEETIVTRNFVSVDSLNNFLKLYPVYYNYLRPNDALMGQTPARAAGIEYDYSSWADLIKDIALRANKNKKHSRFSFAVN